MNTYKFDVVLRDELEITDDQADRLFAVGADDGTPVSSNGLAWIHFGSGRPNSSGRIRGIES